VLLISNALASTHPAVLAASADENTLTLYMETLAALVEFLREHSCCATLGCLLWRCTSMGLCISPHDTDTVPHPPSPQQQHYHHHRQPAASNPGDTSIYHPVLPREEGLHASGAAASPLPASPSVGQLQAAKDNRCHCKDAAVSITPCVCQPGGKLSAGGGGVAVLLIALLAGSCGFSLLWPLLLPLLLPASLATAFQRFVQLHTPQAPVGASCTSAHVVLPLVAAAAAAWLATVMLIMPQLVLGA
jgi:hypothetical protein